MRGNITSPAHSVGWRLSWASGGYLIREQISDLCPVDRAKAARALLDSILNRLEAAMLETIWRLGLRVYDTYRPHSHPLVVVQLKEHPGHPVFGCTPHPGPGLPTDPRVDQKVLRLVGPLRVRVTELRPEPLGAMGEDSLPVRTE